MALRLEALLCGVERDAERLGATDAFLRVYSTAKAAADRKQQPFAAHERAFCHARGTFFEIPAGRPWLLEDALRTAATLLLQHRPVALACNAYPPHHHALQVVLDDCSLLSFVFDPLSGDLSRIYLDGSARAYTSGATCSSALVTSSKLLLGLEDEQLLCVLNAQRDKAKRPYVSEKIGIANRARLPTRRPRALSLSSSGAFLVVGFRASLCVFRFVAPQPQPQPDAAPAPAPAPPPSPSPSPAPAPALALDPCGHMLLGEGGRLVHCQFHPDDPHRVLVVSEHGSQRAGRVALRVQAALLDAAAASLRWEAERAPFELHLRAATEAPPAAAAAGEGGGVASQQCTAVAVDASASRMALGFDDGLLLLLVRAGSDAPGAFREAARRASASRQPVTHLAFHPHGAVVCACFGGAELSVFDCALQPLPLQAGESAETEIFSLQQAVGAAARVALMQWVLGVALPAAPPPAMGHRRGGVGGAASAGSFSSRALGLASAGSSGGGGGGGASSFAASFGSKTLFLGAAAGALSPLDNRRGLQSAPALAVLLERGPLLLVRVAAPARPGARWDALTVMQAHMSAARHEAALRLLEVGCGEEGEEEEARQLGLPLLLDALFVADAPRLLRRALDWGWGWATRHARANLRAALVAAHERLALQLVRAARLEEAAALALRVGAPPLLLGAIRQRAAALGHAPLLALLRGARSQGGGGGGDGDSSAAGAAALARLEAAMEAAPLAAPAECTPDAVQALLTRPLPPSTRNEARVRAVALSLEAAGRVEEAAAVLRAHNLDAAAQQQLAGVLAALRPLAPRTEPLFRAPSLSQRAEPLSRAPSLSQRSGAAAREE